MSEVALFETLSWLVPVAMVFAVAWPAARAIVRGLELAEIRAANNRAARRR